jgi:hypothetical protein
MDVCVLVRVHSRMADLEVCLRAIRGHWHRHSYRVIVLSTGRHDGFAVPPSVAAAGVDIVEIDQNPGHVAGTSLLLQEGVAHVPEGCRYTILLEADTWVHDDEVLDAYISRMNDGGAVWASAEWVEKLGSLAIDCAIVQSAFLRGHPGLITFSSRAELHVARYMAGARAPVLRVPEHMPVHVPRVLRRLVPAPQGRFRCFPAGAMVTHHVEDLAGGIAEKQRWANATLGRMEYDVPGCEHLARDHRRLVWLQRLARIVPRSSWIRTGRRAVAPLLR